MRLNLGYTRVDQIEHVLYVPGVFDEDGELNTPIGGQEKPFTLILRSKKTDEMERASDKFSDGVGTWFSKNRSTTPAKKRTEAELAKHDPDAYFTLVEDFMMTAVIGWKNAPAVDGEGKQVENAPYDANALRETFRAERELLIQAIGAYTPKNSGKFVSLTA